MAVTAQHFLVQRKDLPKPKPGPKGKDSDTDLLMQQALNNTEKRAHELARTIFDEASRAEADAKSMGLRPASNDPDEIHESFVRAAGPGSCPWCRRYSVTNTARWASTSEWRDDAS